MGILICQCDHNFGLYGQKKRNEEKIDIPDEYIEMIENSRNPSFIMVDATKCDVKNFEVALIKKKKFQKSKLARLSKLIIITQMDRLKFFTVILATTIFLDQNFTFEQLENAPNAKAVGISAEKSNDLKRLMPFLSSKGEDFYNQFFQGTLIRPKKINEEKNHKIDKERIEKKKSITKKPKRTDACI